MLIGFATGLLYLGFSGWLLRPVFQFLRLHGVTAANYRKKEIPSAMGIYLWLLLFVYHFLSALVSMLGSARPDGLFLGFGMLGRAVLPHSLFFAAATAVFVAGWIDDSLGDKRVKGLKGHIGIWLKNRTFTTGLFKLTVIVMSAIWLVSSLSGGFAEKAVSVLLIALMTNTLNLLDLRPGRTIKAFFLLLILLAAVGVSLVWIGYLIPFICGALFLLPVDLRADAMLGDTGANLLGFAAGSAFALASPLWANIAAALVLSLLHWIAERRSLTELIEKNRWISWLDRLGRT